MPRPSKPTKRIASRVPTKDADKLAEIVMGMGYIYERDEEVQPAWGEWMSAIATGEILLFKKVVAESK